MAERIDQELARGAFPARQLSPGLEALLQEGAIKVSSRHLLENLDPGAAVNPEQVRSAAPRDVLYVPPCYVVHTPGLFEGQAEVMASGSAEQHPARLTPGRSHETDSQPGKDHDHEQSE